MSCSARWPAGSKPSSGLRGAVYRLAGDEFVVLVEGGAATDLIGAIRDATRRPFAMLDGIPMEASVGAAAWHDGITEPWDLVREADELMYAHKARARS
jgi:GGDEF domain-containing protein